MTQLADYRTAVRLLGYDQLSDAQVDLAIQAARRRVFQDHRWSFLQVFSTALSIAANTNIADISPTLTNVSRIESVRLSDSGEPLNLRWKPPQELRDLQTDYPDEINTPLFWSRRGNRLLFFPLADRAITLNMQYIRDPGPLVAATDDILPTELQDLVPWAAAVTLAFRQRDYKAAGAAEDHYRNLLTRYVSQDTTEQRQTPRQVRSGYWD